MAKKAKRTFLDAAGFSWNVQVKLPGSSNAMIVFHRIGAPNSRSDRYNWYQSDSPEARNVTAHLDASAVLGSLRDEQLALLFRRSMLISAASDPLGVPVTQFAVEV